MLRAAGGHRDAPCRFFPISSQIRSSLHLRLDKNKYSRIELKEVQIRGVWHPGKKTTKTAIDSVRAGSSSVSYLMKF